MSRFILPLAPENSNAARGIGNLVQKTFLDPLQIVRGAVLAHRVDDDGSPRNIIASVDPVELLKGRIRMGFVSRFVVEVVDGHSEVLLTSITSL